MPGLAKPPMLLPRFVPRHTTGAKAGTGSFSEPKQEASSSDLDPLAHDARNVLSSLMVYCDLLSAPDVLPQQHRHYAQELAGIARSAAQIIEMIVSRVRQSDSRIERMPGAAPGLPGLPITSGIALAPIPVTDAAAEIQSLRPLLTAIAGPSVRLSVATMPCPGRTALSVEDFTRILINLVRNAADAMSAGGRVRITAQYGDGLSFIDSSTSAMSCIEDGEPRSVLIAVTDNGPGIPPGLRDHIFDLGFTTRSASPDWPAPRRRGLGLSIVRNLVEAAGGNVRVSPAPISGSSFEIRLPLTPSIGRTIT